MAMMNKSFFSFVCVFLVSGVVMAVDCDHWKIHMLDTDGDGWNGDVITILSCNNTLLANLTLVSGRSLESCLPNLVDNNGIIVHVDGGRYKHETKWDIFYHNVSVIRGGSPFFGQINCTSACAEAHDWDLVISSKNTRGWQNNTLSVYSCNSTGQYLIASNVTFDANGPVSVVDVCLNGNDDHGFVVKVDGGAYPNGVRWALRNETGSEVLSGGAPFLGFEGCPVSPCGNEWLIVLNDTYGDGWNGFRMTIFDCNHKALAADITLSAGLHATADACLPPADGYIVDVSGGVLWGEEISWVINDGEGNSVLSGGAPFYGNFNCSAATPCEHDNDWYLVMRSRTGDGWHGSQLSIKTCNGTEILSGVSLTTGHVGRAEVCLPPQEGYIISVTSGTRNSAVSWVLYDGDDNEIEQGGAPFLMDLDCPAPPCQGNDWDLSIINLTGDKAYLTVSGCNLTSIVPDIVIGSGTNDTYDICIPEQDGYYVTIGGGFFGEGDSWKLMNASHQVMLNGSSPYFGSVGCPPEPCDMKRFSLIMVDRRGDTWEGNTLSITLCNGTRVHTGITLSNSRHIQGMHLCLPESEGYFIEVDNGIFQEEVHWTLLNEFGHVVLSGGAPFAGGYNCSRVACPHNEWDLEMHDDFGDGWSGNALELRSCSGEVLVESISLESGSHEVEDVCIPSRMGYTVVTGGGIWSEEVNWLVRDHSNKTVLSGSAPYYSSTNCSGKCHNFAVSATTKRSQIIALPFIDMQCRHITGNPNNASEISLKVWGNQLEITTTNPVGWMEFSVECCAPVCKADHHDWSIVLSDSYGDGWNGDLLSIADCDGNVLAKNITLLSGNLAGVELCLPTRSGYKMIAQHGAFPHETGWHLLSENRRVLLSGGTSETSFGCPLGVLMANNTLVSFSAASYGSGLPTYPYLVDLVYGGAGCQPLPVAHRTTPFIVVVTRGSCSFVQHTVNAQSSGAMAIVIINSNNVLVTPTALPTENNTSTLTPTILVQSSSAAVLNASAVGFLGNQKCETLVFGSSINRSETLTSSLKSPVCSNQRVNPDFRTSSDRFVVNVNGQSVTVTRVDRNQGWAMNLQIRCCLAAEIAPSSSRTISVSASISPSPSASATKESHKHHPNRSRIAGAVVLSLGAAGVLCGIVFLLWRRGFNVQRFSVQPNRSRMTAKSGTFRQPLMDSADDMPVEPRRLSTAASLRPDEVGNQVL